MNKGEIDALALALIVLSDGINADVERRLDCMEKLCLAVGQAVKDMMGSNRSLKGVGLNERIYY